jgi:hypothetical protein
MSALSRLLTILFNDKGFFRRKKMQCNSALSPAKRFYTGTETLRGFLLLNGPSLLIIHKEKTD